MLSEKNLLLFFQKMLLIRAFEINLENLFAKGLIHGTCHPSVGQEAVAVGVCTNLNKKDIVTSTHRGHGHALAKGLDPNLFLAELLGKKDGYCSGRGGTQHTISVKDNFYANGITGGMVPVACGMAYAVKYKNEKKIVVSFFGDGAMNEGYVNESLNLASIWNLPIIFVCENNLYAMSGPIGRMTKTKKLSDRAKVMGIESMTIDGNNVVKVYETVEKVYQKIKKNNQPVFIECLTYRQSGHSINDKFVYRTREEEKLWMKKDPILLFENYLLKKGISDKKLIILKNKVSQQIKKATDFAIKSPLPDKSSVNDNLYV